MSMIPHIRQTGNTNLGICKHVLISFYHERPLQLRLRTILNFVTNFVKFYTNLYLFLWVFLVLNYVFCFFSLAWLFVGLFFSSFWTNWEILGILPSFWAIAKNFIYRIPPPPNKREDGVGFSKKYCTYNIMSYPTFRHQQKSKN
jgi:hypothetical protein